jgi:hypothetical protein
MRRKAMVTVIAAVQVAWVLAILYGVVWLLT